MHKPLQKPLTSNSEKHILMSLHHTVIQKEQVLPRLSRNSMVSREFLYGTWRDVLTPSALLGRPLKVYLEKKCARNEG